jgi:hypothetical protein
MFGLNAVEVICLIFLSSIFPSPNVFVCLSSISAYSAYSAVGSWLWFGRGSALLCVRRASAVEGDYFAAAGL